MSRFMSRPAAAKEDVQTLRSPGRHWELLFSEWPAVAVADARISDSVDLADLENSAASDALHDLPEEEAAQIAHAVPRRQLEFATVRLCARRAAARLGVGPFVLLNGADRAPRWPAELVGSLTHTGRGTSGYCAAAAARADAMRSIGIDAEQAQPLPLRLWDFVLTSGEQTAMRAMEPDPGRAELLAKIVFSAKECFYKAQFPLTHQYLGFHQVEIALDLPNGAFQARLSPSAPPGLALEECRGRFAVAEDLVRTAIGVPH